MCIYIRRPLPTAGGARQRRDYKQQVLCSASEGQARGDRKGSQVQSKKLKKGSEKGGAGPVQDARQLQEDTGKLSLELVSRQFRRQRLAPWAPWAAGCGPNPSFSAMVFGPCGGVL